MPPRPKSNAGRPSPGASVVRAIALAPLRAARWAGRGVAATGRGLWRGVRFAGRSVARLFAPPARVLGRLLAPVARPLARWTVKLLGPPARFCWTWTLRLGAPPVLGFVRIFRPAPKVLKPYRTDPYAISRGLRRTFWTLLLTVFCFFYGAAFALMGQALVALFILPILLLTLTVIWALPDLPRGPTKALRWFFMAYFIALVAWPNYLALSLPGLPWITMQRLTSFPTAALFLICLSVSSRFRKDLAETFAASPVVWRLVAVWVLMMTISLGFSSEPSFSIQKYVLDQINWTMMYVAGCWIFLKKGAVKFWTNAMWIMALYESIIAVIEVKEGHVPWAGHIPSFLAIQDPSVQRALAGAYRAAMGVHRASATFTTPLGLGEFIALAMPFALHTVATTRNWIVRAVALVSVPLFFLDSILADSRLGMVGCLMSVLMTIFAQAYFRWRRKKEDIVAPAIVLSYPVLALGAMGAVVAVGRLRQKVLGNGANAASNEARMIQWRIGTEKIKSRPWGYGVARAADVLDFIGPGQDFKTIDSYYLSLLLEYGPLGFALYWAMIGSVVVSAAFWGLSRASEDEEHTLLIPLAISLLNFFIIKSVFSQEDCHPLIFMMMAAVTALVARAKREMTLKTAPSRVRGAHSLLPQRRAMATAGHG